MAILLIVIIDMKSVCIRSQKDFGKKSRTRSLENNFCGIGQCDDIKNNTSGLNNAIVFNQKVVDE